MFPYKAREVYEGLRAKDFFITVFFFFFLVTISTVSRGQQLNDNIKAEINFITNPSTEK